MKEREHTSAAAQQREGANTVGVPCAATGTILAPPTTTIIAMEQNNTIHTTAETEVTDITTATVTTPASNLSTTGMTAADTTSRMRTMDTTGTITARMVTETITAKASTPAPTLTTIMMAAADTQATKRMMDVIIIPTEDTIAEMSMADTTRSTSEQIPADMKLTTPPQMMTPVLPPVKVAGDIERKMRCVA